MKRNRALLTALFFLQIFLAPAPSRAENAPPPAPRFGIAMQGEARYANGKAPLSYVNPRAPQGGLLRLGTTSGFDTLNPFTVRGSAPIGLASGTLSVVYESLMQRSWDEPFSLYGLIAQSIEVPEDRTWVDFKLRPEAHFQDGAPITADDVLFSYETLRQKGRPNHRAYYNKVEHAEKRGPLEVRFTFKRNADDTIDREMPLIMGLMPILPEHIWKERPFEVTTLSLPVIGSGPYKVAAVEPNRSITYEKDPSYWGQNLPLEKGLYNFEKIRIDIYRDEGIARQAFKAGAYDLRYEYDPNRWATAYDIPAVKRGEIELARFTHGRPESAYGFVLNLRRPPFDDPALREALAYAFDSGWINKALFHGLYKRTTSFFPNSELAAAGPKPPSTDGTRASLRENLLIAAQKLKEASYELRDNKLYTPKGKHVSFEILLSDPTEEKYALNWTRNLSRLGIDAHVRTVDSAQYQARLASFDYDVTAAGWNNSLSPGNEQLYFWGSLAAHQQGSRNYPGLSSKEIDALAAAIPAAKTREDLIAATQALDTALLKEGFLIPFYHLGADLVAYWKTRLAHPATTPIYGPIFLSWWSQTPEAAL